MRQLWATPVMEYKDLFSKEQLTFFAENVKDAYATFLEEREDPTRYRPAKTQTSFSSTPSDKDKINEEFFNFQTRNPINPATLEVVWQAFVYASQKFVKEAGMPDIDYQRETAAGGELEWSKGGVPRRGSMYCWGSVQNKGTHHDTHTHPGSAIAGTLYLSVPPDGGALYLLDPRGPLPPFQWTYRVQPQEGMFVLFPGTLPHGVHSTPGDEPRISISCNHPGDWQKFTNSRVVYHESTWSHEMMSRDEAVSTQEIKAQ
eukprot:CAMPEP_0194260236 /NCGR_PEP_ID=MMETSP0158-20130606/45401_1 /TAXON_ID=33649 /ORGANISM="Thalassionema nitzschioides, Strain L26-B" /LENGTH=258 /DNA_ID=CAMNT_0039000319 /DNA_START=363 /DNA_END=1139 /DNA_ORIENTATION=-